jgi:hypothetical protein
LGIVIVSVSHAPRLAWILSACGLRAEARFLFDRSIASQYDLNRLCNTIFDSNGRGPEAQPLCFPASPACIRVKATDPNPFETN